MAFVVVHLACQAYRAATSGALPAPGLEVQPWFVASVLGVVWLPFALFAGRTLASSRSFDRKQQGALSASARALAVLDPLALGVTLLFTAVHGALVAWPLLSGALLDVDVQPELVAALSSTTHGVPLPAILYLCGMGVASFCASRQAHELLRASSPATTRIAVALGVFAYLLGSYAVIRYASGSLFQ